MKNRKRGIKNIIEKLGVLVLCAVTLLVTTTIPVYADDDTETETAIYDYDGLMSDLGFDFSWAYDSGYEYFNEDVLNTFLENQGDDIDSFVSHFNESFDERNTDLNDYCNENDIDISDYDVYYVAYYNSDNTYLYIYVLFVIDGSLLSVYYSSTDDVGGFVSSDTFTRSTSSAYNVHGNIYGYTVIGGYYSTSASSYYHLASYNGLTGNGDCINNNDGTYTHEHTQISAGNLVCTNLPMFESESLAVDYVLTGDLSNATNSTSADAEAVGADSFGFNNLTCTTTGSIGNFCGNYDCFGLNFDTYYYDILSTCTVSIQYKTTTGSYKTATKTDSNYINISSNDGYYDVCFDNVVVGINWSDAPGLEAYQFLSIFADVLTNILGSGTDFSNIEIVNAWYTVTFDLRRSVPYYNSYNGLTVLEKSKYSSDVRYFKFNIMSGELEASNSDDSGEYVDDGNCVVSKTYDYDDVGNVTDSSVKSVVINDSSTGSTITTTTYTDDDDDDDDSGQTINIDNSNTNYNTGDDDTGIDADDLLDNFDLTSLLDWFSALFGVDSGLTVDDASVTGSSSTNGNGSIIGTIFRFMPTEFNVVLIGGIAVIIILAIIRLVAGLVT